MVTKQSVDVDPEKCIFCGICVEILGKAIDMQINGKREIPVEYEVHFLKYVAALPSQNLSLTFH